jgi:hypothetical protein
MSAPPKDPSLMQLRERLQEIGERFRGSAERYSGKVGAVHLGKVLGVEAAIELLDQLDKQLDGGNQ